VLRPYSYTDESIKILENKLNNNFVMSLGRIENQCRLAALKKKKEEQDNFMPAEILQLQNSRTALYIKFQKAAFKRIT